MGVDSADWGKAGPGKTLSGSLNSLQTGTILTGGASAVLAGIHITGNAQLTVYGSVDGGTFYGIQFVTLYPAPPAGATAIQGAGVDALVLVPCAGMQAVQFKNNGLFDVVTYTAVAVDAAPFLPVFGTGGASGSVPTALTSGQNYVRLSDYLGGPIQGETWNSIGRLTASSWPAAADLQVFSAPAAAVAASVVIAAQVGKKFVTADGSWSYGAGTGIAAGDLRNVDLLDGATAIWVGRLGIQAAVGYSRDLPVPKGLFSSSGNSMTANFNAAGPANSFQACGLAVKIS